MFPSCPDNKSPGSTRIGANYPDTEFEIPPEDGGWFDGGALPPFGPYPSAGGIPPNPQQPPAGPSVPPAVPPASAPQPPILPPVSGRRQFDDDQLCCLNERSIQSSTRVVPAWQQQLRDLFRNNPLEERYLPAQQSGPPPALGEQNPSSSAEPRQSSRVRRPTSTHPDDVYGSMDPASCLRMDLRHGLANLQARNPAQASQEEPVAPGPFPEVPEFPEEDEGIVYLTETVEVATMLSYVGQKSLAQLCQEGGVPLVNFLLAMAMPSHKKSTLPSTQSVQDWHFQDILWLPTRE